MAESSPQYSHLLPETDRNSEIDGNQQLTEVKNYSGDKEVIQENLLLEIQDLVSKLDLMIEKQAGISPDSEESEEYVSAPEEEEAYISDSSLESYTTSCPLQDHEDSHSNDKTAAKSMRVIFSSLVDIDLSEPMIMKNRKTKGKLARFTDFVPTLCVPKPKKKFVLSETFFRLFKAYAKGKNNCNTGIVMTKEKSNLWLENANLLDDVLSTEIASELFASVARMKLVLNVYDYVHYLQKIALKRNTRFSVVLDRLSKCPPPDFEHISADDTDEALTLMPGESSSSLEEITEVCLRHHRK